jgi:hypothetical protein
MIRDKGLRDGVDKRAFDGAADLAQFIENCFKVPIVNGTKARVICKLLDLHRQK